MKPTTITVTQEDIDEGISVNLIVVTIAYALRYIFVK
jgi:hypothetical protein